MAEETIRIGLTYDQRGEQQAVKGMANVANAAGKASDAVKSFSHKMADQDAYSRFNSQMNNIEKSMGRLSSAGSSLSGALKTLYATMAAYGALRIASGFLETASSLERMQMLLTQVTGNAVAAEKAFKWISELGAKAFGIDAVSDAFVKMQSVGIDPTTGSLQSLIDALSAFGKTSASELSEATVAIQQMAGKGVISMEELRQQLAEKIPTATSIMARELGLSYGELVDKISKGALTAKEGLDALFAGLQKDYGGMADKAADTWNGLMNQLRAQYMLFQKDVMDSGPFDFLKEQLASFVTELKKLRDQGILDQWARDVAVAVIDAFSAMVQAAELFIQTLNNVKTVWIGIKNISAQVNMNKLIAERDAIVSRLDEGFWNKFVFGSVGSEESQKLKTRLKEITAEMGVYSQEMVDNANAVQSLAQKNQQITSSFDTIKGSLNKATKAATEHSAALDPERTRLESVAGSVKKLSANLSGTGGSGGLAGASAKAGKAVKEMNMSDAQKSILAFDNQVQSLTTTFIQFAAQVSDDIDLGMFEIDSKAQQAINQWKSGIIDLQAKITEFQEKIEKSGSVDPAILTALEQMKGKYSALASEVGQFEQNVLAAADAQKALLSANRQVQVAELRAEYAELTGTIDQQIDAVIALYQAKIKAAQVDPNLTAEQKSIQTQIYNYQIYHEQLRKTGTLMDGLTYGFQKLYNQQKTTFDLGVQLAGDLNDAIGEVFESVISGERDIEEAFKDMGEAILAAIAKIASQEIVIPVIFQMSGLSGLLSSGTSSFSSATKNALDNTVTDAIGTSKYNSSGGMSSVGDILGLSSFKSTLSDFFDTEIFSWGGGANPLTSGGTLTIGNAIGLLGGAYGIGTGFSQLFSGNIGSGLANTLGGAATLTSSIASMMGVATTFTSVLGIAGAALMAFSSIFSDLFESQPELIMRMGTKFGEGMFEFDGDVSSETKSQMTDAMNQYFEAWEKAFNFSFKDVVGRMAGTGLANWEIEIGEEDLENLSAEELTGKITNAIIRTYINAMGQEVFDTSAFNMDLLEGLSGKGAWDWDYGELQEYAEDIFTNLYALQETGVEVGKWMDDLKAQLGGSDIATGEFFAALQTSEETIGETMSRVIEGLSVIPDSLARMDILMSGIDTGLLATYRDDLESFFSDTSIDWIFNTIVTGMKGGLTSTDIQGQIASALGDTISQSAKDMINYIVASMAYAMEEGMSASEAYDYLENVYNLAVSMFETPLDEALAEAVETQDFDKFKKTFAESLQDTMIDIVTEVFSSDILNQIISSVFGSTEGLYKLIEQYMAGDIDSESFMSQFTNLSNTVSEKLSEVWPVIQKLVEAIGNLGAETLKTVDDYEEYYQSIIDTGNGIADLGDDMKQLNKWFEEQYNALVELASGGEDVTNTMTMLWDAYVSQLKTIYDEIMGDWDDIIDENTLDEYQQRLKELNESYDVTIRELQVLEEAGIDTSIAVARLTEAYNYQYQAIVDDLIDAIYDASQAMKSFAYDIESTIAGILETEASYLDAAATAAEGFWESLDKFNASGGDIGFLEDALDWLDKWYSASSSAIKARYQAEIDALNNQRDAIEAYYDAQISSLNTLRDQTDAYYQDQIDALEAQREAIEEQYDDQIDALEEYRDQVEETYDAQIEALEEQLELAEKWADVLDQVEDQIKDMLLTTTNPADVFERLSIASGEVDRLRALYESSSGEERAQYAQELMDAISTYMGLLGEAYQRPSDQYMAQYEAMLALLEAIKADATANGGDTDSLEQQIADLTEEQNAILEGIDAQIADLKDAQTAALEAIDSQIESLEEAQTAALEAIDAQIEALENAETAALEGIDAQIEALNNAMEAELDALGKTVVDYYNWLKTLGLDSYQATLDDLYSSLLSIYEQDRTGYWFDDQYYANDLMWQQAIFSTTYDTSLGIGFMIGQLDAIYNRLGSVPSYGEGGLVTSPHLAVVGDEPEVIIPLADLRNGGSTKQGASGGTYNVSISVDARGATASDANTIAKAVKREVESLLSTDRGIRKTTGIARI